LFQITSSRVLGRVYRKRRVVGIDRGQQSVALRQHGADVLSSRACKRCMWKKTEEENRLVVAFDFQRQVAFVKFIGTHAEYDRIDALTISQF
jgi:HigB_toxin, RelE-like toxic component of a toxin-antitoxin system